jgi:hypothetical protein
MIKKRVTSKVVEVSILKNGNSDTHRCVSCDSARSELIRGETSDDGCFWVVTFICNTCGCIWEIRSELDLGSILKRDNMSSEIKY